MIAPLDFTPSPGSEAAELGTEAASAGRLAGGTRLSHAQEQAWLLSQIEPNHPGLTVVLTLDISGVLDRDALAGALAIVTGRHATFRSKIRVVDGRAQRSDDDAGPVSLTIDSVSNDDALEAMLDAESKCASDPMREPLRAVLIARGPTEHVLRLRMHRTVADEQTLVIVRAELEATYDALRSGASIPPPNPVDGFEAFAEYEQAATCTPEYATLLERWRSRLANAPGRPAMPIPSSDPVAAFGVVSCTIDPASARELHALARDRGAGLEHLFFAAFTTLVFRYAGDTDFFVGVPFENRTLPFAGAALGPLATTLSVRVDADRDRSFADHLARTSAALDDARDMLHPALDRMLEDARPLRADDRGPLANIAFAFGSEPPTETAVSGVRFRRRREIQTAGRHDLMLEVDSESLTCTFTYRADRYDAFAMNAMPESFATLLHGICNHPTGALRTLPIVTSASRRMQIELFNDTARPMDERRLHEIFEAYVLMDPARPCISFGSESMSYGEVNAHANRVARYLRTQGIASGSRVAICFPRSAEMIVSVLAVAKCGATYVPLDPEYPPERLATMVRLSDAPIVLTASDVAADFTQCEARVLRLDGDAALFATEAASDLGLAGAPDDVLCILFTSGSTGAPKGVALTHRGMSRTTRNSDVVAPTREDVVAFASAVIFDVGAYEMWLALVNGALSHIVPKAVLLDPTALADTIVANRVSVLCMTPALFEEIARRAPETFAGLGHLLLAGDVCPVDAVRRVRATERGPQRICNVWGPTEGTTYATMHEIPGMPPAEQPLPIGRPIANTEIYILDRNRELLPLGARGELFIGGPGLALGYLDEELTFKKFIVHPLRSDPSARLYASGDAASFGANGIIRFHGRIDRQIKLRGYRIEPGEVEAAMRRLAGVDDAVVIVSGDGIAKMLVGYICSRDARAEDEDRLLAELRAHLPPAMIPERLIVLDAFPMTPTGKVDRRALPPLLPRAATATTEELDSDVERRLAMIFRELLGIPSVGLHDDFFALGGQSLLAVRLMGEIELTFGVHLPLTTLFKGPTIAHLAQQLLASGEKPDCHEVYVLNEHGTRPPLFFLHGSITGGGYYCRTIAKRLGLDQPVVLLRPLGLDGSPLAGSIEEIAEQYLEMIRALRPQGPYHLAGFSAGGLAAFEIARRLRAAGEEVPVVLLIDVGGRSPKLALLTRSVDRAARTLGFRPALRAALGRSVARLPYAFKPDHSVPAHAPALLKDWVERARCHVPQPYDGIVTYAAARCNPLVDFNIAAWTAVTRGLDVRYLPGDHQSCIVEHVDELSEIFDSVLTAASETELTVRGVPTQHASG